jgi:hypothetical protein
MVTGLCKHRGQMGTLYDELGVAPEATADELRRAYYRRARELHPDVNPAGQTDEAMRRVNQAWAILGHPISRRRYDLQLAHSAETRPSSPARPAGPPPPPRSPAHPDPDDLPVHISLLARLLRPSALILAVLLVIFVVTAYAGQAGHTRGPTVTTTSTSLDLTQGAAPSGPLPAPMGNCLLSQPGFDAMVPCSQPNNGMVVAAVANSGQCPEQTKAYQLAGRPQWVCLAPISGSGRLPP